MRASSGFTLLELLLALTLLAVVTGLAYMTFSTVATAWQREMRLSDSLQHGDFIMDQLVMGLRSAYCPEARNAPPLYGFWHTDDGEGETGADMISWVKTGAALVGRQSRYAGAPHRVQFFVEPDEDGRTHPAIRSWQLQGQPEDFDSEEVEVQPLPGNVLGFNCRAAYRKVDGEIDWQDEWEHTNKLPTVVELTLYLEPLEEDEEPIELKRLVGIPAAALQWGTP